MNYIDLPIPKLKIRQPDLELEKSIIDHGLHPILARILASRPAPANAKIEHIIKPSLNYLDHPLLIADMQKAAMRLAKAIIERECIGIETDHDCDGQTSHAVFYYNLVNHFKYPQELIKSYIGHRLTEGYGLSLAVANRIINDNPQPKLIITADNGSSDEDRIKMLKAVGIDVIVTDHHQLPIDGPPASAYACLNPTRDDCQYKDKYIAGCMVAWLLMSTTRQYLIDSGYLAPDVPKLLDSLDFVSVGTIADCVSLARSKNNRAIVQYGLKLINQGIKPCWRAIQNLINNNSKKISSEDLGFVIGPLLNSDGRLASAFGSVSFLLSNNDQEAHDWINYLQTQNIERKAIQRKLIDQGIIEAAKQVAAGKYTICIYLDDGHAGVHGIAASRIKEKFGRPTIFLADKCNTDNIITGSIRGIEGFNVYAALQYIVTTNPALLNSFGGHVAAGGLTLNKNNLNLLTILFEEAAQQQLNATDLGPVIWTDGVLSPHLINIETLEILANLEPYGREFELPVFQARGYIERIRFIGDGTHARLTLFLDNKDNKNNKYRVQGVWFNCRQNVYAPILVKNGDLVDCAFTLKENIYQAKRSCELNIITLQKN